MVRLYGISLVFFTFPRTLIPLERYLSRLDVSPYRSTLPSLVLLLSY